VSTPSENNFDSVSQVGELTFLRLTALFARFFFEIFSVKDIPFTASWGHMTGKRANLLTHDIVDLVLALKKIVQSLFGFQKCPPLVGKFGKSLLAQTAHDQVSEMRDPAL
jgi:hypothetical protein